MHTSTLFAFFLFLSLASSSFAVDCPFNEGENREAFTNILTSLCQYNKLGVFAGCCSDLDQTFYSIFSECKFPGSCGQASAQSDIKISFSAKGLTVIPGKVFNYTSITYLDLSYNSISSFASDAFAGLENLKILNLREAGLSSVPSGLFSDLTNLDSLLLALNTLSDDAFVEINSLQNLKLLELNQAGITSLPSGCISNLSSLTYLDLSLNSITTIQSGAFSGVTMLTSLMLAASNVNSVEEDAFVGLQGLKVLDFRFNSLATLPQRTFKDQRFLTTLYLNSNLITSLPAGILDTTIVNQLVLSNNLLTKYPKGLGFKNRLFIMYLTSNKIKEIEKDAFGSETGLFYLHMQNNELTTLPSGLFAGMNSLTGIHLSDNSLEKLPGGIFRNLPKLSLVDLHGNHITSLPDDAFDKNNAVTNLTLSHNPINNVSQPFFADLFKLVYLNLSQAEVSSVPDNFFTSYKDIRVIDMSFNSLTELPSAAFEELKSLSYLDLSNNLLTALPANSFQGTSSIDTLTLSGNCLDCSKYAMMIGKGTCGQNSQHNCPLPTCKREQIWAGCYECSSTDEGSQCITCNYGYAISGETCVLCSEKDFCPTNTSQVEKGCLAFDKDNCTKCKKGYHWEDKHCLADPSNNLNIIIPVVVVVVVLIAAAIIITVIVLRRKDKKRRIQQLNQASVSTASSSSSVGKPLLSTTKGPAISMQPLFGKFKNLILSETPFENGVFGALYLADLDGSQTIVKVVSNVPDSSKSEMKKNIETFSKINHACLIRYLGIAEVSVNQEIVMEYIGGKSLKLVSHSTDSEMSPELKRRCLKDICYAMSYLHSRNIVHKFLRLYNVVLIDGADETTVGPVIRLTEYGLGRSILLAEKDDVMSVDPAEAFYIAPEVLDESESESVKSDIYSFGILSADLWNSNGFTVNSDFKTKAAFSDGVISQGLRPTIDDDCPEDLRKLAISCWQKKESRRPAFNKIIASFF